METKQEVLEVLAVTVWRHLLLVLLLPMLVAVAVGVGHKVVALEELGEVALALEILAIREHLGLQILAAVEVEVELTLRPMQEEEMVVMVL